MTTLEQFRHIYPSDSWLKVEWAKKHIAHFEQLMGDFFRAGNYSLVLDSDFEQGRHAFYIQVNRLPIEVGLVLGDALHNLRSALDCAFYATVLRVGGTSTEHTKFPIARTRKALVGPLGGGSIKQFPLLQKLILDTIQPYETGDDGAPGNSAIWA